MRRGRFVRNKSTIIFSVLVLGFSFYMKLSPAKFNNFTDIMLVALSFSSLATALFFSCFSLIPAFSNSKFIIALQELGTDKKIMDRLLLSTIIFFISSILSFGQLFFSECTNNMFSIITTAVWLSFTLSGFFNTFLILAIVLKAFEHYANTEENDCHKKLLTPNRFEKFFYGVIFILKRQSVNIVPIWFIPLCIFPIARP